MGKLIACLAVSVCAITVLAKPVEWLPATQDGKPVRVAIYHAGQLRAFGGPRVVVIARGPVANAAESDAIAAAMARRVENPPAGIAAGLEAYECRDDAALLRSLGVQVHGGVE